MLLVSQCLLSLDPHRPAPKCPDSLPCISSVFLSHSDWPCQGSFRSKDSTHRPGRSKLLSGEGDSKEQPRLSGLEHQGQPWACLQPGDAVIPLH